MRVSDDFGDIDLMFVSEKCCGPRKVSESFVSYGEVASEVFCEFSRGSTNVVRNEKCNLNNGLMFNGKCVRTI